MANIGTQIVTTEDSEYAQVCELRENILRRPIGLSLKDEDLWGDKKDVIWIAKTGDKVIACLMLQPYGGEVLKLRQMAVAIEMQGKGVGKLLVNAAEAWAKKMA